MGLSRIRHVVAEISYDTDEWRLRVVAGSRESYPACYFQDSEPAELPGAPAYIRLVPRHGQ